MNFRHLTIVIHHLLGTARVWGQVPLFARLEKNIKNIPVFGQGFG